MSRYRNTLAVALITTAGCGEGVGTAPTDLPLAFYGACGRQPNYAASVQFNGRFREFPVSVFIDLGRAAPDLQGMYLTAIQDGFQRWGLFEPEDFTAVEFVASPEDANITTVFVTQIPGAPLALAASRPIEFEREGVVAKTTIEFSNLVLAEKFEERFRAGLLSPSQFVRQVAALTAHEYGHSLGIQTHPTQNADFLMSAIGFELHTDPTEADRNTIRENYCQ
ncbi:MAG: hypothetical protein MJB57_02425 [Gemmatimonadetes bacterium]|nr:hypothetical protein [Gemmatimonadota bacterium]